jgi:hypothetical protein
MLFKTGSSIVQSALSRGSLPPPPLLYTVQGLYLPNSKAQVTLSSSLAYKLWVKPLKLQHSTTSIRRRSRRTVLIRPTIFFIFSSEYTLCDTRLASERESLETQECTDPKNLLLNNTREHTPSLVLTSSNSNLPTMKQLLHQIRKAIESRTYTSICATTKI